ncbi:protocadherin-9, partial [Biomphalaria pfeifferi]
DSGCLISPSHSILRGNTSKGQGNYSRPPSGSGFDRAPFLMTFQSSSENGATNGGVNGVGSSSNYGTRKDQGGNPTSPRQVSYYSAKPGPGDKSKQFDKETSGNRTYPNSGSDHDKYRETTMKKCIDDGYVSNGSSSQKFINHTNGFKKFSDRLVNASSKGRDARLCSEPPVSGNGGKGATSPSYNTPMQETGLTPSPSPVSPSMMYINNSRSLIPRSADTTLRSDHSQFRYPPSPSYLQTTNPSPHSFKQASCPQLYKNSNLQDPHSQGTLPASNRSRAYNAHEMPFSGPSMSLQDILNESLEGPEDSNTTTTSGSYTIDHEELTVDLPPTDVFV